MEGKKGDGLRDLGDGLRTLSTRCVSASNRGYSLPVGFVYEMMVYSGPRLDGPCTTAGIGPPLPVRRW